MKRRTTIIVAAHAMLFVIVAALIYATIRHVGMRNVLNAMRRADTLSIVVATLLTLASFVVWTTRWTLVIPDDMRRGFAGAFSTYMAGILFNIITPGASVGGEPVRAYYMGRAYGGSKTTYLGSVFADKLVNLIVFLGFVVVSLLFTVVVAQIHAGLKALLVALIVLIVAVVVSGVFLREHIGIHSRQLSRLLPVLYNGRALRVLRQAFPRYEHFEDYVVTRVDNLFRPFIHVSARPATIAAVAGLSAAGWLLVCAAHQVLFYSVGAPIDFVRVLAIVTLATIIGDVSMAPGGAGVTEAAMVVLCTAFGVDPGAAAAVTLIARGIYYALGIGLGGACFVALAARYGLTGPSGEPVNPARRDPPRTPPPPPAAPP